jgi:hypothetical protein
LVLNVKWADFNKVDTKGEENEALWSPSWHG